MLVAMVDTMPQLLQLCVADCTWDFDNNMLVNAAVRVPALEEVFLEYSLGDDAFDGLWEIRKPLALR
ncbi:hypothetical protein PsorP6_003574 [Peronosclerospora sorghi]|uniref:Uncharacterized protein n=1 Tax=Peronosclerospora sorghi TaxID=230839 RepID=A0ACC0VMR3_9STRA|nr:hypothetical protein PsorP6_003574 [Peronosclerospora sorghi]